MSNFDKRLNAGAAAFLVGAFLGVHGQAMADDVIADDLIVQGSTCTGFDCVNNESFGFDTLRLKENNLQIHFNDTSVSPFPNNSWRIIANDSTSGGASYLTIEDSNTGNRIFKMMAGAPANALFGAANGKIGLRTATPGLDIHINSSDTPAHRFEQNSSGGFTAQTWDIGANEANFFVRDLTGGSRLPFRVRPGAPTSSVDIAASGNVGIGTASPNYRMDVVQATGSAVRFGPNETDVGGYLISTLPSQAAMAGGAAWNGTQWIAKANTASLMVAQFGNISLFTNSGLTVGATFTPLSRLHIDGIGNMGVGTNTPAAQLHTTGTVRFANYTGCSAALQTNSQGDLICSTSSRQFKNVAGDLLPDVALANIMALRPQTGTYKETPDVPEHWFIAEDVATVDPALVGMRDGNPYVVKTQNIVADLVAVIQQQQRRIEALERALAR
jgi:hypothetical protein